MTVDRTGEFHAILAGLGASAKTIGRGPPLLVQSELNILSSEIGAAEHAASQKVQELRRLAKSRHLFNDRSRRIEELMHDAQQDVQSIQRQLSELEQRANRASVNGSCPEHARAVVDILKTRLVGIMGDLKEALEDRTKSMETQSRQRLVYNHSMAGSSRKPTYLPVAVSGNRDDPEAGFTCQATVSRHAYQSSRDEAVQSMQSSVNQVAQMFRKMAEVVASQDELVRRIDTDVTIAGENVEKAQLELSRYLLRIQSNRGLIVKVFLILLFFVVFFVGFLS